MRVSPSIRKIFYDILFLDLLINEIIEKRFPIFTYEDEVITIICLIYILLNLRKFFVLSSCKNIFIVTTLIIILGLAGNIVFKYQKNLLAIFKDIFAFSKVSIVSTALIIRKQFNKLNDNLAWNSAYFISKWFVIIVSVFGIISLFKNIGMSSDYRYGIYSYEFLYSHPTFLAFALVLTSVILILDSSKKRFNLLISLNLFSLIITMRSKALAYVLIYIVIIYIFPLLNIKKVKTRDIILPLIIAICLSASKIKSYLQWSWSQRAALYSDGFSLMESCFPLGSGFASFASDLSGKYYSPIYEMYNLNLKPGMNYENFSALGDAGIAYYYSCFGLIGFILFIYLLRLIYINIVHLYTNDMWKKKAILLLSSYVLVSLPFEAVLTNESGVALIITALIFLGARKGKVIK